MVLVLFGLIHVVAPKRVERAWALFDAHLPKFLRYGDPPAFPAQSRGILAIILGVALLISQVAR